MAARPKLWKAEYAKSGRSSCKSCENPIDKETFRLGKMVKATQFDGFMPMWSHADCILKKAKQIKSANDVEGIESLRWEDQQKIRRYVEDGGVAKAVGAMEYGIEVSHTSLATCNLCDQKIMEGEVRISSKPEGQGARGLAWHHSNCFMDSSPSCQLETFSGWEGLSPSDQAAVSAAKNGAKGKTKENNTELPGPTSKPHGKRGRDGDGDGDQRSKVAKAKGDISPSKSLIDKNPSDLDAKLKVQSKELWALKDDLKMHVTTAELRQMLKANGQSSKGSGLNLRDLCADGMMFGALGCCPKCSGCLCLTGSMYCCDGYLSAWTKCSYSIHEPKRMEGKWEVPENTNNQYLSKWYKSQESAKPVRILPPQSYYSPTGKQDVNGQLESESLRDLKVVLAGFSNESMQEWKGKIEGAGGQVHAKIEKDTNCFVLSGVLNCGDAETREARRMKLPIVSKDYLVDCLQSQRKVPFDSYKVEAISATPSTVIVKVKGRSAVHEASGLQDTGHILEDGQSIYSTTLNMSDLPTGVNSYYILQIIQEDKGSDCCLFRKWGRVGNEKNGGSRLKKMPKSEAISKFKRLFLQKTGNPWEDEQNFQKKPGKFFWLDNDNGVKKVVSSTNMSNADSKLPPPVVELMMMLSDVEAYKAAVMQFKINMSEMPFGNLSKSNIKKGFEALTEIQNLLNGSDHDASVKESELVDASNRFFNVIPSIHPHVIRDQDDVKLKVEMLEALQQIEVAARLFCFDYDNDLSLDDKYKKLQCDMAPLPHDSEDYQLIDKYLRTTHSPTHREWSLELEEVFSLERKGEKDKFAPYREQLKNRMLLWHGSRWTNVVGILREGLKIAPPEAPKNGYRFGKGIYFADLVSKSAHYCHTDKKNPVGLMLLSEVALGEVCELTQETYMEKPPAGKNSTKALGKKVPKESEFQRWRNDVVVPCGKPVPSRVKTSELKYNEYIVYNTAQVKMQFLLKVRFHHKRSRQS